MCGIFGILSGAGDSTSTSTEEYFKGLSRLLSFRLGGPGDEAALAEASETLAGVRRASYGLIARGGFLAVLRDGSLRARLEDAARSLREWSRALEAQVELGTFKNQRQAELANTLMVGSRDLEWQIERDVLSNLEPVRRLLGGEDLPHAVLGHGWQLNLVLNSLDRLEVRGRDSAGLAVYLRF